MLVHCIFITPEGLPHSSGVFCPSLHLEVIRQQFVLTVAESEGQKCQDEGVQDADDGQDVGPAHRAVPQAVLIRHLAAHPLHLRRVPAVRVDHAAHHHQHRCGGRGTRKCSSLGIITLVCYHFAE